MNMNMDMGMNNMNMNQGMRNMNQIYMQVSQLMAQAMININQIMTNMNQLMNNMNLMNQLINSVNGNQSNNELNNINFLNNKMDNTFAMKFNSFVNIQQASTGKKFAINCNTKDKLMGVIQLYRIESGDNKSDLFIYNGIALDLEKTIEEIGIKKGSTILCIEPSIIG